MGDVREVVNHLIERGLLRQSALVNGAVTITEASRRHEAFSVYSGQEEGLLIKVAADREKSAALRHEARVYALFQKPQPLHSFRSHVPALRDFHPAKGALVIQHIPFAESLREYVTRRSKVSLTLARKQGEVLAALHNLPARDSAGQAWLPEIRPWALSLSCPKNSIAHGASGAALQCLRLIQQTAGEAGLLKAVEDVWSTSAIIHGDARFDNWLAVSSGTNRRTQLRLIDWELSCYGDPCWDVAAVFCDFLSTWVLSIPVAVEMAPEALLPLARFPLEKLQPAIQAFWKAYAQAAHLGEQREEILMKSVRFTALRLIQFAFEISQEQPQLAASVVCLMQIAVNILERPGDAAIDLLTLGISDGLY